MQVVVAGGCDYYPGSASASPGFSFAVRDLRIAGEGDLLARIERLRSRCAPRACSSARSAAARRCCRARSAWSPARAARRGTTCSRRSQRRGWAGRLVWAFAPVQDRHAAPAISRALADLAGGGRGRGRRSSRAAAARSPTCWLLRRDAVPHGRAAARAGDRLGRATTPTARCSTTSRRSAARRRPTPPRRRCRVRLRRGRARERCAAARRGCATHGRRAVLSRARTPRAAVARAGRALRAPARGACTSRCASCARARGGAWRSERAPRRTRRALVLAAQGRARRCSTAASARPRRARAAGARARRPRPAAHARARLRARALARRRAVTRRRRRARRGELRLRFADGDARRAMASDERAGERRGEQPRRRPELTYEAASARVEEIIRRLDSGEAGLARRSSSCSEGKTLIEFCAGELERGRARPRRSCAWTSSSRGSRSGGGADEHLGAVADLPARVDGYELRALRGQRVERVRAPEHGDPAARRRRGGPRRGRHLRRRGPRGPAGRGPDAAARRRLHDGARSASTSARSTSSRPAPARRLAPLPPLGVRVGRARPRAAPGRTPAARGARARAAAGPLRRLAAPRRAADARAAARAARRSTRRCASSSTRRAPGTTS